MDEYDRLFAIRRQAIAIRDWNLVGEIEMQMMSIGFVPPRDTPLDDTPAMKERAVSNKLPAKRGKR